MTKLSPESVTFWQVNNVVPVVVTFIGMAISFAAWSSRVSVLETKMDLVIAQQSQILQKYSDVQIRLGTDELILAKLYQIHPEVR